MKIARGFLTPGDQRPAGFDVGFSMITIPSDPTRLSDGGSGKMNKKRIVRLTEEEREQLRELVTKGKASAPQK
jgi:hypothetical protein